MPIPQTLDDRIQSVPADHVHDLREHSRVEMERQTRHEKVDEAMEVTAADPRLEHIARMKRQQRPHWHDSAREGMKERTINTVPNHEPAELSDAMALDTSTVGVQSSTISQVKVGNSIERPRSALHRGDFREEQNQDDQPENRHESMQQDSFISTSPPAPWTIHRNRDSRAAMQLKLQLPEHGRPIPAQGRNRSVSHSTLNSSFTYRFPTSPLALSANNADTDNEDDFRSRSRSPSKNSRRRTFSPGALRELRLRRTGQSVDNHIHSSLRRERTFPQQTHQARRSISSLHSLSSPLAPTNRSRRSSIMSDGSPLSGAPMVGGYEESILRGRMSTFPSKPLDFVASIGVLGKGNCKSNLRCPSHISVPFPAVFYNYGSPKRSSSNRDSDPSPYVGLIDLEARMELDSNEAKQGGMHVDPCTPPTLSKPSKRSSVGDLRLHPLDKQAPVASTKRHKRSRASNSLPNPPGGYRIPQKGQLQVVIKNPNKTAVKLFLIPYDLDGMQPGQKTFIRQRSFSVGPAVEIPLSQRQSFGIDLEASATKVFPNSQDRPVLRYLIHLHICCPSHGRFFLYKSIRVVFANRVPDGKEKLKCEVQLPQPLYSVYRPESHSATSSPSTFNNKRFRDSFPFFDEQQPISPSPLYSKDPSQSDRYDGSTFVFPPRTRKSSVSERSHLDDHINNSDYILLDDLDDAMSPRSEWLKPVQDHRSSISNEEPLEFKRTPPVSPEKSESGPSPRDGLLAKQLRDLANADQR